MGRADAILARALALTREGRAAEAIACLTAEDEVALSTEVACTVLGLLHASLEDNARALACFDRALRLAPGSPIVLANRAVTLQRLGNLQGALVAYGEALAQGAENAELHYNRGTALHLCGRLDEALASYHAALALQPAYGQALAGRALALQELGRSDEALAAYESCLGLEPNDPVTHYNRGNLLRSLGRMDEALTAYRLAQTLKPDYVQALCGMASALQAMKRYSEALACCEAALRIDLRCFDALFGRANALQELRRHRDALTCFDAALEVRPSDVGVLCNRAVALLDLDEFDAALASCDAALRIAPDFPEALSNRGNILLRKLDFDGALAAFDAALKLRPAYVEALGNRGVALKELGRFQEALASFNAALALDSNFAHALNNKGALLLLLGRFAPGWAAYESRWMAENVPVNAMPRNWPQWSGEPLAGKKILVLDEQGLGDVLQFSRYLPLLARAGGIVTLACRPHLHRLLGSLPCPIRFVASPPADETFDYEIPLVSLPKAFRSDLGHMPADVPYLHAEPERVATWAARVGSQGFRIGICWQGNPNPRADVARAVPLHRFAPLAAIEGVRLISLQRHVGLEQLQESRVPVETLGKDFDAGADAFLDAAAVMANLDLVVTCDTSIAHLAGALARPVWVALKQVPDWRFLLDRDDMPWYPTMRLFRQKARGDWAGVFEQIAAALQPLAASREPG